VVQIGDTIYHYLDGVANGSGAASSVSNAFADIQIGYDGTNYMDATALFFSADDVGAVANKVKDVHCTWAQEAWDERSVPFLRAQTACPALTFD
jgi:hypothetical protein